MFFIHNNRIKKRRRKEKKKREKKKERKKEKEKERKEERKKEKQRIVNLCIVRIENATSQNDDELGKRRIKEKKNQT